MRKLIVSIVAAGTALSFATPAAAQYAPQPGYGAPYGYAYGHGNDRMGHWQRALQQIRVKRDNLRRSGRLSRAEARDLNYDISNLERAVYHAPRGGIAPYESRRIEVGINRVREELRRYSDYEGRDGRWVRR